MTGLTNRRSRDTDSGFTVVEVIIAALVLTAVVSAIGLAAVGGNRLQGAARAQVAMTDTGKRVLEYVSTDRSWMESEACRTSTCDLVPTISAKDELLDADSIDGRFELPSATAEPIDSEADGEGPEDEDGLVPDFFRIEFVLRASPDIVSRYGRLTDRTVMTTIDRRGVVQKGSLAVEVCRILNQADDRMAVQGCPPGGGAAGIRMDQCPTQPTLGCVNAFNWVSGSPQHETDRTPHVMVRRVPPADVPAFRIVNSLEPDDSWSSADADRVDGMLVFQNLPSGTYRIEGLPASLDATTERWALRELPAYHGATGDANQVASSVSVEAGVRNKALVLYRPRPTTSGINMDFWRVTKTRRIGPAQQATVRVVDRAPTLTYSGDVADFFCGLVELQGGENFTRTVTNPDTGLEEVQTTRAVIGNPQCRSVPEGQNCVRLLASFTKIIPPFTILGMTLLPGLQLPIPETTIGGVCSYYSETHTHTFHRFGGPTERDRQGAAAGATYWVAPKPDQRALRYVPNGRVEPLVPQCRVEHKGQCEPLPPAETGGIVQPSPRSTLVPGLNTVILAQADQAGNVAQNRARQAPAGAIDVADANPRGIWVRPNGSFTTPDGTEANGSTTFRWLGEGECYWENPSQYPGEMEDASCNPCAPIWRSGLVLSNVCSSGSILTRTEWFREAWEEWIIRNPFNSGSGSDSGRHDMQPASGVLDFSPPLSCGSAVPSLAGCSTNGGGGGGGSGGSGGGSSGGGSGGAPRTPTSRHSSSSGGLSTAGGGGSIDG